LIFADGALAGRNLRYAALWGAAHAKGYCVEPTIRIANETPYGLAAAVWSRDIFRAFRAVKALRAGIVWVNHMQPTYVEAPWGGYKQAGFGRELGPWAIEEYLDQAGVHQSERAAAWVVLMWKTVSYWAIVAVWRLYATMPWCVRIADSLPKRWASSLCASPTSG